MQYLGMVAGIKKTYVHQQITLVFLCSNYLFKIKEQVFIQK